MTRGQRLIKIPSCVLARYTMSSTMPKRTYTVLIEQDEDGIYVAKVPDIIGCHTQGKTVSEVMKRIKEAIQVCSKDENVEPLKFIGIQQIQTE